jgi:hypothetical protein
MAGLIKKETPLDTIKKVWVKAKEEERKEVLRMVLEWKEQKIAEAFTVSPGGALSPHPSRLGGEGVGENGRDFSA